MRSVRCRRRLNATGTVRLGRMQNLASVAAVLLHGDKTQGSDGGAGGSGRIASRQPSPEQASVAPQSGRSQGRGDRLQAGKSGQRVEAHDAKSTEDGPLWGFGDRRVLGRGGRDGEGGRAGGREDVGAMGAQGQRDLKGMRQGEEGEEEGSCEGGGEGGREERASLVQGGEGFGQLSALLEVSWRGIVCVWVMGLRGWKMAAL
jgi:hypothetical protein